MNAPMRRLSSRMFSKVEAAPLLTAVLVRKGEVCMAAHHSDQIR
eukprot:CAMPEP_0183368026 /NCGR_PEP_ID=MMETSP0164_2-20130417/94468_1 /TAXON_ID=221442 /ORGANISM="Coccolithus pelagicus ssp braarudi, Strain PLY182g" /LENGTH=43 /DNA_ID= /DNA_START= /DNA_END= /DNA_ORIENTATION=